MHSTARTPSMFAAGAGLPGSDQTYALPVRRTSYPVKVAIVLAFSVLLGHLSWSVWFAREAPEHFAEGTTRALRSPDESATALYVRRTLHLPEKPENAWIQVLARDRLAVHVNQKLVSRRRDDHHEVGTIRSIGHHLREGLNVIAIATEQRTFGKPPVISVKGSYTLSDGEHVLSPDEQWRSWTLFERQNGHWTAPTFDDSHWERAEVVDVELRAPLEGPPAAVSASSRASWITPPISDDGRGCLQRTVPIPSRPRSGWLRATSTGGYRFAVNGVVVGRSEARLAAGRGAAPVERIWDVTAFLDQGENTVSFLLSSLEGRPHLRADLEIETVDGRLQSVPTDSRWIAASGAPARWSEPLPAEATGWTVCRAEPENLGVDRGALRREWATSSAMTPARAMSDTFEQIALILAVAIAALLACRIASRALALGVGAANAPTTDIAYLALVLPTLMIATVLVLLLDPRVPRPTVYHQAWILLAVLSVPLQWLGLALLDRRSNRSPTPASGGVLPWSPRRASFATWVTVAVLFVVGFGLRLREIEREPLHHDEVRSYRETLGVLERGYPSAQHADSPLQVIATSELVYYPMAAVALVSDDDRFVVRFPAVCFGAATILLMFFAGRRMFGVTTGLVAATIQTFAPLCVAMSGFGRYPSQLAFFSVLTTFCFWRCLSRPDDRRALWLTALAFCGMYLSWQGSATLAAGMVVAALIDQRGRLRDLLSRPAVWGAMLAVACVVALHLSYRDIQAAQRLYIGTGISNLGLGPMWTFGDFDASFYLRGASWSENPLLPMLALVGAFLMAVRHGFQRPTRVLGITFAVTCVLMASLLPVRAFRYGYHLVPFVILLASATLTASIRALTRLCGRRGAPRAWVVYARGVGIAVVCVFVALTSGVGQLGDLTSSRSGIAGIAGIAGVDGIDGVDGVDGMDHPDVESTAAFLRAHLEEGDIVLATKPHVLDHYLPDRPADYWLQTRLQNRVMLGESEPLLRDRRSDAVVVSTRDELEDIFARHDRVWYVFEPYSHALCNEALTSSFVRQHMDVAYRGFSSVVLFRGSHHRPSGVRFDDEVETRRKGAGFFR